MNNREVTFMNSISMTLTVKNGEMIYPVKALETRFKEFLKNLPDNSKIEVFVSAGTDKGTLSQIAKIHAMIRELANELGYTFEEMKLQTKRQSGLCIVKNNEEYCKSFADCDKQELSAVIQTLFEIGDFANVNLR